MHIDKYAVSDGWGEKCTEFNWHSFVIYFEQMKIITNMISIAALILERMLYIKEARLH